MASQALVGQSKLLLALEVSKVLSNVRQTLIFEMRPRDEDLTLPGSTKVSASLCSRRSIGTSDCEAEAVSRGPEVIKVLSVPEYVEVGKVDTVVICSIGGSTSTAGVTDVEISGD